MESIDFSQPLVSFAIAQAIFEDYRHDVFYLLASHICDNEYICYLVDSQDVSNRQYFTTPV